MCDGSVASMRTHIYGGVCPIGLTALGKDVAMGKGNAIDCRVWNERRARYTVPDHVTSAEVEAEITAALGVREVSDAVAVTIAAQYQSPGSVGRIMAQLTSLGQCEVEALLDDIAATRAELRCATSDEGACVDVLVDLDALATWAINHPSRDR